LLEKLLGKLLVKLMGWLLRKLGEAFRGVDEEIAGEVDGEVAGGG
jgi:hypothetical protein